MALSSRSLGYSCERIAYYNRPVLKRVQREEWSLKAMVLEVIHVIFQQRNWTTPALNLRIDLRLDFKW